MAITGVNSENKDMRVLAKELLVDGRPVSGGGGTVSSDDISDATTVGKGVLTAADQAAARTAMGAGTSNLALGTTATTALAGNTAIPAASTTAPAAPAAAAAVGTGATFARADHVHPRQTGAQLVLTGYAAGTAGAVAAADTVNAAIAKLEARIAALEA
ncbi:hypothetical protein ACLBWS_05740 [Brucellaceae bacterium D45D]